MNQEEKTRTMHDETLDSLSRRDVFRTMGAAALLAGLPALARANSAPTAWPTKPVRVVVPFPAGGGTDTVARPLTKVLSQQLGQQFIVDNRGGAGGTLGAEIVGRTSAPDGYTLLVGAVHHTIAPALYPKLGYDLQKDLVPVTPLAYFPNVVVVNPQRMPVKTFAEFQALVKRNPGKYNFGSAGNGTSHHLAVELWKSMAGTFATHIPYRGAGPALQDLLAGQLDFMFDGLGSSIGHIRSGRLRALAVTSKQRSFLLPDLPTVGESVPGYDAQTWYALFAPAGTPPAVVARLQEETAKALAGKDLAEIWKQLGAEPGGQSPEALSKLVAAEMPKWAKVVRDSGAKVD